LSSLSLSFAPKGTRFIPSEELPPQISVSERTTPPPLPAGGPLNSWRGKAPVTGEQMDVRVLESGRESCVIELHGKELGEPEYLALYEVVGQQVWHHCPNAGRSYSKDGPITFENPDDEPSFCDGVEKAVRQVNTLIAFVQLIGGDIGGWVDVSPSLISDLHDVYGATGPKTLPGEVVLRLAACFAEVGRRDGHARCRLGTLSRAAKRALPRMDRTCE
jgi:hypothetical protein